MKTNKILVISYTIVVLFTSKMLFAQVSTGNNFGFTGDYVGWNSAQAFPLVIKHEAQQPINFHTFAGAGTLNNLRMFIEGNTGRVGIGNFASANTLLHVHESAANTEAEISISNNTTGNTTLDGFRMGSFNDNSVLFCFVCMKMLE